jgi:hypothetical protein
MTTEIPSSLSTVQMRILVTIYDLLAIFKEGKMPVAAVGTKLQPQVGVMALMGPLQALKKHDLISLSDLADPRPELEILEKGKEVAEAAKRLDL